MAQIDPRLKKVFAFVRTEYSKGSCYLGDERDEELKAIVTYVFDSNDEDYILDILQYECGSFEYLPNRYKENKEFAIKANTMHRSDGIYFENFKDDYDVGLAMFRKDDDHFLDSELRKSLEFCRELFDDSGDKYQELTTAMNILNHGKYDDELLAKIKTFSDNSDYECLKDKIKRL